MAARKFTREELASYPVSTLIRVYAGDLEYLVVHVDTNSYGEAASASIPGGKMVSGYNWPITADFGLIEILHDPRVG